MPTTEAATGTPGGPDTDATDALDAYSRIVTTVAEKLIPSVASLKVMGRVPGGRPVAGQECRRGNSVTEPCNNSSSVRCRVGCGCYCQEHRQSKRKAQSSRSGD